jgi:hypothetical protein
MLESDLTSSIPGNEDVASRKRCSRHNLFAAQPFNPHARAVTQTA